MSNEVGARLARIEAAILELADVTGGKKRVATIERMLASAPDPDGPFDDPMCSPSFTEEKINPTDRCVSIHTRTGIRCNKYAGHTGQHSAVPNNQSSQVTPAIVWL